MLICRDLPCAKKSPGILQAFILKSLSGLSFDALGLDGVERIDDDKGSEDEEVVPEKVLERSSLTD